MAWIYFQEEADSQKLSKNGCGPSLTVKKTEENEEMRHKYYKLVNKKAVPCEMMEWAKWHEKIENRRVAETFIGPIRVSTVCLGMDHQWDQGPPLLFETMIFGGPDDEYCERCSTWEQAEEMHRVAVEIASKH